MYAYHGLMFAHRGYHNADHGIPENSMPAFQKAIAKGYGIELDLHLTADGELVVFHDDTLTRMCGRDDVIESMTSKELTRCRLLNTRETIPLFRDVLALVDGQVPLLIELKIPSHSMDICEETYLQLQSYTGSYMIQSFNTMGLKWFRTHAPHVLRGQLSSNLTRSHKENSWLLRFVVKHLLCNAIGRPDFISYKLHDLPSPGVWILKNIFRAPIAVWTLRTPKALRTGKAKYDIQIFENQYEN
jgi:glycerophosphoryl diester phosphodiesterase